MCNEDPIKLTTLREEQQARALENYHSLARAGLAPASAEALHERVDRFGTDGVLDCALHLRVSEYNDLAAHVKRVEKRESRAWIPA